MTKHLYIIAVLISCLTASYAQPTIIFKSAIEDDLLAGQMLVYEDVSGEETFEEVSVKQGGFVPNINTVPHYWASSSAIWLKTNIRIETDEPVYLNICYPTIDTTELFIVGDKGQVLEHSVAGALVPLSNRDLEGAHIKFQLKKGLYTYYIKAKTTYSLQLPIRIRTFKTLYEERLQENILQGSYLGFAILIALYTFFLWFSLRDRVYIFYILHIIATAIVTMHLGGYSYLLLWPNNGWINLYQPSILALSLFSTAFAIVFLEAETKFKTLNRLLLGAMAASIVVFPIDMLGYHIIAYKLVQIVIVASCVIMLIGGVISYSKGFKSARFFLLAWTIFLIGVVVSVLQRAGLVPLNYYTMHAMQIGSAIDMVLLSFALADRINILREESEKAKEETYTKIAENEELVRQQNALLSHKVEERSREMREQTDILEKQKAELEELNTTKDKIFSVIAHDLRGPLGNVSQLADMMWLDKNLRNEETIELLKDASKRSFDLLDSLLHWAKAQYGDSEYQLAKVNIYALADDTMQLYSLKAKAKEISIENKVPKTLYANADLNMINTVIRNLVSNALKFTLVGGTITLGGTEDIDQGTISFWVSDSGLGIAEEKLKTIFEAGKNKSVKGTDGETGTGLGLVICKDFVEKNGGTIVASSQLGRGSKFTITLPSFKN